MTTDPCVQDRACLNLEDAMTLLAHGGEARARDAAQDKTVFQQVYRLAWLPVVRCIECATRDRALAEDIAQQTFIKVWHARGAYQPGSKVLPWMRTIARRTLIDVIRRRQLERQTLRRMRADSTGSFADPRLEEAVDARRASRTIWATMERLPAKQAEALRLVASEGGSLVDLAERLGDSPLALRLRLHRARATLRKSLDQQANQRVSAQRCAAQAACY